MSTIMSSMLIAKAAKGNKKSGMRRLDQLLAWLGDDFDGCIMFDEAHKVLQQMQQHKQYYCLCVLLRARRCAEHVC
jgi:P-loop containing NTP hydrolase pore-1